MNIKRNRLVIVAIILLLIIGAIVLITSTGKENPAPKSSVESKGPGTVIIDNTDGLSNLLLPEQYQAVGNALAVFMQTNLGPNIQHASISGQPAVEANGSVDFTIKTDSPEKTFVVTLDRSQFNEVVMTIPAYNFTQIIPLFTSPEGE